MSVLLYLVSSLVISLIITIVICLMERSFRLFFSKWVIVLAFSMIFDLVIYVIIALFNFITYWYNFN